MKYFFNLPLILLSFIAQAQCSFDMSISPANPVICPNTTDTLWSSAADSYIWYRNGVPIIGSNQPFLPVSQQSDAGASFIVVGTIAGCSEPSPAVTLSNAVTASASISIAEGLSPEACTGEARQLVLSDPYNNNIRWFRDGVQLNGQTNDTLTVTQSGLYSAIAFTDVCPLFSQPAPPVQLSFSTAVTPNIAFNSSTLVLSTSVQAASYIWEINGMVVEGANESSFLPQANGEVTVTAVFNAGCERTSQPFNYNAFVQDCEHNPTVNPEDLILCPNASDTLFTQTADSYRWFRNGVLIQGEIDSFLVVNQFEDAGSTFSVEATVNGCAELSPEVLVDGWIFLPLTVSTQGNLDPLCEGDTLVLEVLPPFTEGVQWMFNSNPIEGATNSVLEISETGTYSVMASTDVCPDYNEISINLEYSFLPRPQPVINYFSVSNTLSADVLAASYVWYLDGESIAGATTQIITPTAEGNYTVMVTYASGCSNISEAYFYEPLGLNDIEAYPISFYPNPAGNQLWINTTEPSDIQLFDMVGRLVQDVDYTGSGFIDLSAFESGSYLFVLKNRSFPNGFKKVIIKQN